jgi:ADP-ribosylation factor GTPase-activating protein 2/3
VLIFCGADIEFASEFVPKIAWPTPLASSHLHCFNNLGASGVPSALNATSLSTSDSASGGGSEIKSNILQKKTVQAKKKGLGAQKVNADFKEIERNLHEQEKLKELEIQNETRNKEEAERNLQKQMASMKLAYDNLDKQREKEEAKLKQTDPKKAQQLERLGMAAGNRNAGITHSALSDMQIIQQEGVNNSNTNNKSSLLNKTKDSFFDDFESQFSSKSSSYNNNK